MRNQNRNYWHPDYYFKKSSVLAAIEENSYKSEHKYTSGEKYRCSIY